MAAVAAAAMSALGRLVWGGKPDTTNHFERLPTEIFIMILLFCHPQELFLAVPFVCKAWHAVWKEAIEIKRESDRFHPLRWYLAPKRCAEALADDCTDDFCCIMDVTEATGTSTIKLHAMFLIDAIPYLEDKSLVWSCWLSISTDYLVIADMRIVAIYKGLKTPVLHGAILLSEAQMRGNYAVKVHRGYVYVTDNDTYVHIYTVEGVYVNSLPGNVLERPGYGTLTLLRWKLSKNAIWVTTKYEKRGGYSMYYLSQLSLDGFTERTIYLSSADQDRIDITFKMPVTNPHSNIVYWNNGAGKRDTRTYYDDRWTFEDGAIKQNDGIVPLARDFGLVPTTYLHRLIGNLHLAMSPDSLTCFNMTGPVHGYARITSDLDFNWHDIDSIHNDDRYVYLVEKRKKAIHVCCVDSKPKRCYCPTGITTLDVRRTVSAAGHFHYVCTVQLPDCVDCARSEAFEFARTSKGEVWLYEGTGGLWHRLFKGTP